jgi:transglutaminase-like putative cysteine protease
MSTPAVYVERRHPAMALLLWFADRFRPHLGWITFFSALLLVLLPVQAVREAGWVNLHRMGVTPEWVVFFGLIVSWMCIRWGQRLFARYAPARSRRFALNLLLFMLWLIMGALVVSQVVIHWIPSPLRLWQVASTDAWPALFTEITQEWMGFGWRFEQWIGGVQTGGALQDNLIFLAFIGVILWCITGLTAWLALRTQRGLFVALPPLWILTLALYYSNNQRWLLIVGLAIAILLHFWLDHAALEARWQQLAIDYSPMLLFDRLMVVVGAVVLILVLAALIPSPSVTATMYWAYENLRPVYEPIQETGKRLFPELERQPRGRFGTGIGSGLPNRFMLGAGPTLTQIPVMWLSTDRSSSSAYYGDYFYEEPSIRFYMRRATFAEYNGRGWLNPVTMPREPYPTDQPWWEGAGEGRAILRQRVRMASPTDVLYAAGEPLQVGLDYQVTARSPLDLVALWSQEGPVTRFEVVSAVPSLDDERLYDLPAFDGERPLPAELDPHLLLPDTVTERTIALAEELTAGLESPYARAAAIEQYLRTYSYDLDVSMPPADVDVADYFLFDLQRGYCDYYATAFVVLARLADLPTRFVTGYVPGGWIPEAQEWLITEAEAHSWPEVYFAEIGWVPFEPTAGRSTLPRVRLDAPALDVGAQTGAENRPTLAVVEPESPWNWQMLFWLLPVLLLLVFLWQWLDRRQPPDPWLALLSWGRRIGRPARSAETELEYGRQLAHHLVEVGGEPERVRRLSRSVVDLSEAVSEARYGSETIRSTALERALARWQAIRRDIGRRFW